MELDEKKEHVKGDLYRYSSAWIQQLESERHWRYYWHQQKIMEGLVAPGDHVLEIGVGTGFTSNYLRSKGVKVTTLDIDSEKRPEIHANIVTYNFDQVYDHILAFEVFEHIPFNEVERLFCRLSKVCRKYLFISIPRNERTFIRIEFWLPVLKQRTLHLSLLKRRITDPHHHWEMDWKKITRKIFYQMIKKAGYELVLQKIFWNNIYLVLKLK